MFANRAVQVRVDSVAREEAAAVLLGMGLTVSDAVRLLLTRITREEALPFEPPRSDAASIKAMSEADKGGLTRFDSAQVPMNGLNAPD